MDFDLPVFPPGFYWGASTAGHQVEGGNQDQWTIWELAHAKELAKNAAHKYPMISREYTISRLPIWQEAKDQIQDPNNYVSGTGVDHYRRFKHDFDLLEDLNLNAYRFSIEWSRLEPEEGKWDEEAFNHYREYIKELRSRKIEPFVNIWHTTLPTWFSDKGAFEKHANLLYWKRFIKKITDELLDEVKYVITINEPNVYATYSYLTGEYPPNKKDALQYSLVYWHLTRAHRAAYKIIKNKYPDIQIGIASQLANIQAKRPHNLLDEIITKWMRYFWNWWFFRRTRKEQDFIGFNYYFTDYYRFDKGIRPTDPKVPLSDLGWYMEPEGIYPLLLRIWARYKKPIFITENGIADSKDQYRRWWIEETIVAMERAISEGVDLRGYFHWSLLDNFEWAYGWWPKFGLVEVDREHGMRRKIRPSARWFASRIKQLSLGSKKQ
ncbi:MAG TPA: family 1 glycosylhydrolase [Patescibacteria group bacterium]|nr:family 1 glycosylhydrolase [Patescibacteria group bacterium]